MALNRKRTLDEYRKQHFGKGGGTNTVGRVFMIVFALPFAGGGVAFFLFLVYPDVRDWMNSQSWHAVHAEIVSAELKRNASSKSTTYQAIASYRYNYLGQQYTGSRVALSSSADNIGSFQEELAGQLQHAWRNKVPVTVFVNPADPSDSIINRDMRWGLLALKMVFVVAFAGAGLGIIIFAIKKPKPVTDSEQNLAIHDPSMIKKEWASPVILSGAKTMLYVMWGFAIFWNLLTLPVALQIPAEVARGEYGILVVLVFNIIGIIILVMAIRKTLEWRRFGKTPFTMDPHPGAIGGHVGGTIDIHLPYTSNTRFDVTLSNVRSYVTGSGKNRSRHESIEWQNNMTASNEPSEKGTRVRFRFDVPDNLRASEKHSNDYYKWYVDVKAELAGVDLERRFEIPVLDTGEKSRFLPDEVASEQREDMPGKSTIPAEVSYQQGGMELYYPMGRAKMMSAMLVLFGALFSGIGVILGYEYASSARPQTMLAVMGTVFFLVGALIEIGGIYAVINSLWVRFDAVGVRTKRCLFGVAVFQRNVVRADISDIKMSKGAQSGSTVYYSIFVHTRDGRKLKVGETYVGAGSANAMVEKMKQALDL